MSYNWDGLPTAALTRYDLHMAMKLRKAGSIWVDGDLPQVPAQVTEHVYLTRTFDREVELASLSERVSDGVHTLLTAQRRMGKTSLVRELLRRLADGPKQRCWAHLLRDIHDDHETLFVDFEDAETAEDAVAELAIQAEALQSTSRWIRAVFACKQCPARAGRLEASGSTATGSLTGKSNWPRCLSG